MVGGVIFPVACVTINQQLGNIHISARVAIPGDLRGNCWECKEY